MKLKLTPTLFLATLCSFTTVPIHAGTDTKDAVTPTLAPPTESVPVSQEFLMETSVTGSSITKQGNASIGGVQNINSHFNYVVSPQVKDGILLRLGADWERNSFSLPAAAPLPNTLQSTNLIIGSDMVLSDKIIMRAEVHPGLYSDFVNITGSDFDMPLQVGGTYLWSKDFQIILGLQLDLKSSIPLIGIPGFRWQFADNWVLSAFPPKPRLEYEYSKSLTFYTGAEVLGGTYHLNDNFGSNHGHGPGSPNTQLNGNIAEFAEFRVGAGATWKFTPNLTLDVSGGYMPYRSFDIHEDKIDFNTHSTTFHNSLSDGAPYGEVGISGSF